MNMKKIPLPQIVGGVLMVGLVGIIIYGSVNGNGTSDSASVTTERITVTTAQTTPAQTTTEATTTTIKETTTTQSKAERKKQALIETKDFFSGDTYSSKSEYVNWMKSEGYTSDEIQYALKNYKVDWNEQALGQAVKYICEFDYMSNDDLRYYLELDGYTDSQIKYALGEDDNTYDTTTTTSPPANQATLGEQNALSRAITYINYTHFSWSSLKSQLEYEGYSSSEAEYGVNNCGADWNEQAAGKARDYLNYSAFSREGLRSQLEYEGFTDSQIDYALSAVGY